METEEQNQTNLQETRPTIGERVVVVTRSYRCLGYVATDGEWREDIRHEIIPDVIGWENL